MRSKRDGRLTGAKKVDWLMAHFVLNNTSTSTLDCRAEAQLQQEDCYLCKGRLIAAKKQEIVSFV